MSESAMPLTTECAEERIKRTENRAGSITGK
jgi:hypothetical protein